MTEERVTRSTVESIDILRIMEMIPHRYPFLMIDRVIDLVPDERATREFFRLCTIWQRQLKARGKGND